ncbi:restriction endonuclease subunit S [Marinospirillum insulare]|uniref:Type I restriction modification DNA specificity domain-containing protein n=1 Tax=Marinospirillum insulare TaxID=217169 RepID=A0ABQ6A067_9GAMM|nr:restriction endonuclease subunit S [Marinospirillum insulare]GLR63515.1 hypothetical protein GCM10007878_09500 [Marinospirillum insulare]
MGWAHKKLMDVCILQRGFDLPKAQRKSGEFPLISSSGYIDFHSVAKVKGPGVVTGRSGSIGQVFYIKEDFWPLNTTLYIKDFHGNDPRFVFYLLESFNLSRYTSGAGVPTLNRNHVHDEIVHVPVNVDEQKRLVAILDEAFAGIEQARAKTEQNLKNARELFESYLQQVFSQRGKGWVEKTLGEAVTVERGSSPRPIKNYQTDSVDGVNWVKIGDTKEGQKYIEKTKEKITRKGAEKSRFVDVGDFILSNSMSFGRPYIMATQGYIHDGWFVLRLPENIDTEYFYYLLSSPYLKDQFQSLAAGAIVKNISGDLVKKAILPIPPTSVQKNIALKLATLASEIERLEEIYNSKAKNIEELKQSILQKAFSGELAKNSF